MLDEHLQTLVACLLQPRVPSNPLTLFEWLRRERECWVRTKPPWEVAVAVQLPGLRAQNRHIQHRRPRPGHRGGGDGGLVQWRGWRPEVELKWIISHLSGTYGQVALAAAKHGHGQGVSTSRWPDVPADTEPRPRYSWTKRWRCDNLRRSFHLFIQYDNCAAPYLLTVTTAVPITSLKVFQSNFQIRGCVGQG